MSTPTNQAGFSLLEILVASFVFALMASMAVTLLSASVQGSEQVDGALDRVGSLDRFRVMLRDDMGQLALRPVREADGMRDPVVFAAATNGVPDRHKAVPTDLVLLVFTRGGATDTSVGRRRSSLIRVEYVLRGDRIVRRVRGHPDAGLTNGFREQILIEGVSEVGLEALVGAAWVDTIWVPAGPANQAAELPRAVRLHYSLAGLGRLEHFVLTSTTRVVA
ncbi:GspJ family type II secretion system protein [Maricaulis salignorans]|uniref:Type II secretion system protein J n=1 Tax=Maricaulis salignorans TaxID=144026 RepID=A0A1G9LTR6_9PROT|nr:type II secretion system protein GspJ [Maricaulis salignorans]SDL65359.1 type II secretion system protein J (GspJ) [Maricaulis salignorans]